MAWESRIANPVRRRWVVAGLMVGLLAGTTLVAAWMTRARQPRYDPGRPNARFGEFALTLPAGWSRRHRPPDANGQLQARLTDGSRLLDVRIIQPDNLTTPDVMIRDVAGRLCPATSFYADMIRGTRGPLTARLVVGNSIGARDGQPVLGKDLVAAATVDGQRYLVLHLSGLGRIQRDDVRLLERLVMTAMDRRYDVLEGQDATVHDLRLSAPADATVFVAADGGAAAGLWLASGEADAFYRVEVRAMTLDQLRRHWRQYGVSEADRAELIPLLAATLEATYYSATGRKADRNRIERGQVAGRTVLRLGLANTRQHHGHHERWAVALAADRLLLMDLVSDRRSLTRMGAAARHIVEHATVNPSRTADKEMRS